MSQAKILLISHDLSRTGAPKSLLRQAGYLRDAGYSVTLWTLADGPMKTAFEALEISVACVGTDFAAVRRQVRAAGKDFALVICNTRKTFRYATAFAALGRPVVWFIREAAGLKGPLASNKEFAQSFRTFYNLYTVSAYARDYIAPLNPHVRYFNNAVEDRFMSFAPVREGEVRFGFLGSIVPHKGIAQLVSAYCALPPTRLKTSLRIAGRYEGTELGAQLRRATADRSDIVWQGEVAGADLMEFFNSIDVQCVPSLDESSGLTLLEGSMYGKALLSTDHVGANYVIGERNGCIVPLGEIGRGLQYFLDNADRLTEMQHLSRQAYLEMATPERERADVLKMVADNLSHQPPPGTAEIRPVRQFFLKEDVGTMHWRFRLWGVPVLKCRKQTWVKRLVRRVFVALGISPDRLGYAAEA